MSVVHYDFWDDLSGFLVFLQLYIRLVVCLNDFVGLKEGQAGRPDFYFITHHKAINWLTLVFLFTVVNQLLARAPKSPSSQYIKMGLARGQYYKT